VSRKEPEPILTDDVVLRLTRALTRARPGGFTEAEFLALAEAYERHVIESTMVRMAMNGEMGMVAGDYGHFRFVAPEQT
jgi:hypothetical protein